MFKLLRKTKRFIKFIILAIIIIILYSIFTVKSDSIKTILGIYENITINEDEQKVVNSDIKPNINHNNIVTDNKKSYGIYSDKYTKKYVKKDLSDIEDFVYEGMNKDEKLRLKKEYEENIEEMKRHSEGLIKYDEWENLK